MRQRVVFQLCIREEERDVLREIEVVHQVSQRVAQLEEQLLFVLLAEFLEQLVYLRLQLLFGFLVSVHPALVQRLIRQVGISEVRTSVLLEAGVLPGQVSLYLLFFLDLPVGLLQLLIVLVYFLLYLVQLVVLRTYVRVRVLPASLLVLKLVQLRFDCFELLERLLQVREV